MYYWQNYHCSAGQLRAAALQTSVVSGQGTAEWEDRLSRSVVDRTVACSPSERWGRRRWWRTERRWEARR